MILEEPRLIPPIPKPAAIPLSLIEDYLHVRAENKHFLSYEIAKLLNISPHIAYTLDKYINIDDTDYVAYFEKSASKQ
jgi:hypothetical protein